METAREAVWTGTGLNWRERSLVTPAPLAFTGAEALNIVLSAPR